MRADTGAGMRRQPTDAAEDPVKAGARTRGVRREKRNGPRNFRVVARRAGVAGTWANVAPAHATRPGAAAYKQRQAAWHSRHPENPEIERKYPREHSVLRESSK
ncbi:hypothetical protein HAX54_003923, partial [Datura stramonium]|nr:hypothetical protein [Datura stramonium]